MATGGIQLIDTFRYSGKKFLDLRQEITDLTDLKNIDETSVPDGFTAYVASEDAYYKYNSSYEQDEATGRWRIFEIGREIENEEFIYAIVDEENHLLFGIRRDGSVKIPKGIPDEITERMKSFQIEKCEGYVFVITDKSNRLLFGIRDDGSVNIPKGVVEVMTWEEYQQSPKYENTLYVIQGKDGMLHHAILNGHAITVGEEYAFWADANILYYHGELKVLPKIWIDYEEMTLNVDYPSDYNGPLFINEDGLLFLV